MKVFTISQVAKRLKVARRTATHWFDSGRLKGYRIPGSQDRRIPREHLIRFLKEHGMPLGDLDPDAEMIAGFGIVRWEYEDMLDEAIGRTLVSGEYDLMHPHSELFDGVRMFPYIEVDGKRHFLSDSPCG